MSFNVNDIRQQFPVLAQPMRNGAKLHYLDNAATAQIPQCVLDAYVHHEITARANVQRGSYYLAEQATQAYQQARLSVSRYLHAASADEIIFTSGTTAAINCLAQALAESIVPGDEIVVSEAEHHSNFLPWQRLCQQRGAVLRILPVKQDGQLALENLSDYISERCCLIAVTHCSNVTGAITEVATIVEVAKQVGAKVFLDGAQMVPHGPVDVQALGIDFYAFSGHKCFAPNGVGVLWGRGELLEQLPPFHVGGGMVNHVDIDSSSFAEPPRRFEAGTPAIAQAVALGKALDWMMSLDWQAICKHEQALFQKALQGLQDIPSISFLGPVDNIHTQAVMTFTLAKIHPHDLCHILDQKGVAMRGGHHCAQLLLRKMGVFAATRFSLAMYNNDEDIDAFLCAISEAIEVLA